MAKHIEDESLIFLFVRSIVTFFKTGFSFIGLGVVFFDYLRASAIKNFGLVRRADKSSFDELMSVKRNKKEFDRIKSSFQEF